MKRFLGVVLTLMLVSVSPAQWVHRGPFPNASFMGGLGCHGIVVDPDGKVWIQLYGATDSIYDGTSYRPVRQIFVFYPDGTPAPFSGFKTITISSVTDTLFNSGRGMRKATDGHILIASGDVLYKVNYKTGAGIARVIPTPNTTLTAPAVAENGNVYTAHVLPDNPVKIFDASLVFQNTAIDVSQGYSRAFAVTANAASIYWAGLTNHAVYKYSSPDPANTPYTVIDTVLKGFDAESFAWDRKTGYLWASAGSYFEPPNLYPGAVTHYKPDCWYAYDTATNTLRDSLEWVFTVAASPNERPRAIDFSVSGDTAYVGVFGDDAVPCVRMYTNPSVGALQVVAPNGGERWALGTQQTLRWIGNPPQGGSLGNLQIELTTNNGVSWSVIIPSTPAGTGSCPWTVAGGLTQLCRIRMTSLSTPTLSDKSDGTFIIAANGLISETEPNNTTGQANSIGYGDSILASLSSSSDVDYYAFHGNYGDTIDVLCTPRNGSNVDVALRLTYSDGSHPPFSGGRPSAVIPYEERMVFVLDATDLYYLIVNSHSFSGSFGTSRGQTGYRDEGATASPRQAAVLSTKGSLASSGDYALVLNRWRPGRPYPTYISIDNMFWDHVRIMIGVYPNGLPITVSAEYGTSTAYGSITALPLLTPVEGLPERAAWGPVSGLTGATLYHWRPVATNADGTTYGYDQTFNTPAAPDGWRESMSGDSHTLTGIAFADTALGVAVGSYRTILRTTNGGTTWSIVPYATYGNLHGVAFPSPTRCVIVGESEEVQVSTDGGLTFTTRLTSPFGGGLMALSFADALNGTAVGYYGNAFRTTDGGESWTTQFPGPSDFLWGVDCPTPLIATAVGNNGRIIRTTNGGSSWSVQASGTGETLESVCFVNPDTGFVVGANGLLLKTTNAGSSWTSQTLIPGMLLVGIDFSSPTRGFIASCCGPILKTTDGGTSWVSLNTGTFNGLTYLKTYGSDRAAAVGNDGTILLYREPSCLLLPVVAGWNLVSVPVRATDMKPSAIFSGAASPYYIYNNGYVKDTVFTPGKGGWLKFGAAGSGTACGNVISPKDITVNSGWNIIGPYEIGAATASITTTPPGIVTSSYFGYSPGGYAIATTLVSGQGYWVNVTQAGTLHLPSAGPKIIAEVVLQDSWPAIEVRDASGARGVVYLARAEQLQGTYLLPPLPPEGVPDVRYNAGTYVEALGKGPHDVRLTSLVAPITVTARNFGGTVLEISDGINGSIVRSTLREGVTVTISCALSQLRLEELSVSAELPTEFSLEQNYPNPFNPVTTIRFGLPKEVRVHMSLYNTLGERVLELADRDLEAGYHQINVDAAHLASGTYFYKLEAGGFVKVRKMLLLK